jgi:hypothetical protein
MTPVHHSSSSSSSVTTPVSREKKIPARMQTPLINNKSCKSNTHQYVFDLTADTPSPPSRVSAPPAPVGNLDSLSLQLSRSSISENSSSNLNEHDKVTVSNASKKQTAKYIDSAAAISKCSQKPTLSKNNALNQKSTILIKDDKCKDEEKWQRMLSMPLPNGWTLFDYQKESVLQCLKDERVILALDMGLGKTIISVVWAKAMRLRYPPGCCVAVVIAPCTLQETWKRESEMMGFNCIANSNTSGSNFDFDRQNLIEGTGNDGDDEVPGLLLQASWSKIPSPKEISDAVIRYNKLRNLKSGGTKFVVVCDEAHAMQSITSQRTQVSTLFYILTKMKLYP